MFKHNSEPTIECSEYIISTDSEFKAMEIGTPLNISRIENVHVSQGVKYSNPQLLNNNVSIKSHYQFGG